MLCEVIVNILLLPVNLSFSILLTAKYSPEVARIVFPHHEVFFQHCTALLYPGLQHCQPQNFFQINLIFLHLNFCILRKRRRKLSSILQFWMWGWNRIGVKYRYHPLTYLWLKPIFQFSQSRISQLLEKWKYDSSLMFCSFSPP